MLTDLADVLRKAGLPVIEVAGWKTRGYNGWKVNGPYGGLAHHTATPANITGNFPTLRVLIDGHASVPGPLAQLGLGKDGTWYVIAAGYCNHAGPVSNPDYANARAIAVEAEHSGTGPWPKVQYDSYVRGCAALGKHYNIIWRGHKEEAVPKGRKVDPNFDMAKFRRDIKNVKEVSLAFTEKQLKKIIREVVQEELKKALTKDTSVSYTNHRHRPKSSEKVTISRALALNLNYGTDTAGAARALEELNGLRPEDRPA